MITHNIEKRKIKCLWITSQPIASILRILEPQKEMYTGGWLEGASKEIKNNEEINLAYCFQYREVCEGYDGDSFYFSMPIAEVVRRKTIDQYKDSDFVRFKKQIEIINPDVIHIFGTETWFQRQFAFMLDRLNLLDRTVVWIQGLTSFNAMVHTAGLSEKDVNRKSLWEFLRGTNIAGIRNRLRLNGVGEISEIKILKNVFVRTDWDTACCRAINSKLQLSYCNETLRSPFYEDKIWDISTIERYSVFMSQYSTPIKGFHQMLKAMAIIVKRYPDATLYVTGENLFEQPKDLFNRMKRPSFFRMIKEMMSSLNLENHVRFLGTLMGKEMRDRYVKSHVFVSASSIENSPNSVGEAMILGVPTVASDVGGVSSLLKHNEEGLLYPFSEYTMLADYVCRIFKDDDLALNLSQNARKHALHTHDRKRNYEHLLEAYRRITALNDNES